MGYFVGVGNLKKKEIWGANMVFKKEVFKKIGFFDPKLGPQKGKHINGEDTDLIEKARTQLKVAFLPEANAFHIVMSNRLTLRYILRWAYYSGRSQRIMGGPGKLAFVFTVKRC
jgi:GT2 family glycosyltransferase